MYDPGSSKKNEVGGPNRKLPFLNVHTQLAKKGRCRHSPISSLKYHCFINGTLQYGCPLAFLLINSWKCSSGTPLGTKVLLIVNRTF